MTEQGRVKESLIEIFKKNGYSQLDHLTQRDYDHLSQQIEASTGTLISGSTIKRLLHGEFSRLPQIATLDAISRYLGYKSWQEYKSASSPQEDYPARETKKEKSEIDTHKNVFFTWNRVKQLAVIGLLVGVIGIAAFIQFTQTKQFHNFDKSSFSARKITSNDIPNTVVFTYNVDEVMADSFFIQQSWDKNRRVRIFKNNYTLTDIYYEPGYHIAKLIANDSVISALEISIPTKDWFFFAKDTPSSKPEYIKADHAITEGLFGLTDKDLLDNKINISKEKEYVYTFFPGIIKVSSDNYVLRTRIRMKEVKHNFCPYITLEVFSQRYSMFVKSTSLGCSSEAMLQFGENFISGKETDLACLGFDVRQWMNIEVAVKNKQVKIMLNSKEVFSTSYKNATRHITGLGFISNGLCEIDFLELKGLDGTIVYENEFYSKNK